MTEGIWKIPILNDAFSKPKILKNAPNATGVHCDAVRRNIIWAKEDKRSTRIWQVNMEKPNADPEVVFEHFASVGDRSGLRPSKQMLARRLRLGFRF